MASHAGANPSAEGSANEDSSDGGSMRTAPAPPTPPRLRAASPASRITIKSSSTWTVFGPPRRGGPFRSADRDRARPLRWQHGHGARGQTRHAAQRRPGTHGVDAAQTRALARRRRLPFPGCHRARFIDATSHPPLADGGDTSLKNLVLPCTHHHRLLHEGGSRSAATRRQDLLQGPDGRVTPRGGYRLRIASTKRRARSTRMRTRVRGGPRIPPRRDFAPTRCARREGSI